jgi:hypothetical protein
MFKKFQRFRKKPCPLEVLMAFQQNTWVEDQWGKKVIKGLVDIRAHPVTKVPQVLKVHLVRKGILAHLETKETKVHQVHEVIKEIKD